MANEIIAVMGATGTQGSGVVKELLARGQFGVRVLTRNPNSEKAQALKRQGCEKGQVPKRSPPDPGEKTG